MATLNHLTNAQIVMGKDIESLRKRVIQQNVDLNEKNVFGVKVLGE